MIKGGTPARGAAPAALKFVWRHWFKVVLAAVAVYIILHFREIAHEFINVAWFYVLLAILANLASIMLKVASWKIIFDYSFRGVRARWRDLTSSLMIGFLVNALVPARAGELARAYVITRRQSLREQPLSRSTILGTIVLERVFDGVAMGMLVIYGVVHMDLPGWADRGAIAILLFCLIIAALLVLLEAKREKLRESADAARERHRGHHRWWKKYQVRLHGILARFSEGQQALRSPVRVAALLLTTSASWISQLVAVYLSLFAFHLEDSVGMMGALLLLILINVAGALPATPGNVGVFQLATVLPLMLTYGIGEADALAFSIGLQAIEGSIGLGVGSAFLLREHLSFRQVKSESISLEEQEIS